MADNENFFSDNPEPAAQDDSNLDDFFQPAAKPAPAPKPAAKPKAATPPPQRAVAPTPPPPPPPMDDVPYGTPLEQEMFPIQKGKLPPTPTPLPPATPPPAFGAATDEEMFPIQKGKMPPPPPPPVFNSAPPMQEVVQEDFPMPGAAVPVMDEAPVMQAHDGDEKKKKIKLIAIIASAVVGVALIFGGGGYFAYKAISSKGPKKPKSIKVAKPTTKPVEKPTTAAAAPATAPTAATPSTPAPTAATPSTPAPAASSKPTKPAAKPATPPPAAAAKPTAAPAKPAPVAAAKPAPAPVAAAKPATPPPAAAAKPAPAPAAAKVAPFVAPPLPELPPTKSVASGQWTVLLERVALSETMAADADKVRKAGLEPYRYFESRSTSFVKYTVVASYGSVADANDVAKKILAAGYRPIVEVASYGAKVTVAATLSEGDAKAIIAKIEAQGVKGAKIEQKPMSAKLQVLGIGAYGSEAEAADAANKARSAGFGDAIVKRMK